MGQRVRVASGEEDVSFMLGLGSRLADVINTSRHDAAEIAAFQASYTAANLREASPDSLTLVAVTESGERLGFLHALPGPDGISGRHVGYVALLAVVEAAEGQGIGTLLLKGAEEWARRTGYAALTLDVFASNGRGRHFYEKNGFAVEALRMVKPL